MINVNKAKAEQHAATRNLELDKRTSSMPIHSTTDKFAAKTNRYIENCSFYACELICEQETYKTFTKRGISSFVWDQSKEVQQINKSYL